MAFITTLRLCKYDIFTTSHLRNEINFWNDHGIMNTSGLLQVSEARRVSL